MASLKKKIKNGAARKLFGPSYFVTDLVTFLLTNLHLLAQFGLNQQTKNSIVDANFDRTDALLRPKQP